MSEPKKERSDKGKLRGPRKPKEAVEIAMRQQARTWFIGLSREDQDDVIDEFNLIQEIALAILSQAPEQSSLEVVSKLGGSVLAEETTMKTIDLVPAQLPLEGTAE